jgi:hypothetical protein
VTTEQIILSPFIKEYCVLAPFNSIHLFLNGASLELAQQSINQKLLFYFATRVIFYVLLQKYTSTN